MIHEFDPVIYPRKVWITYDANPDELNEVFPAGDTNDNKFKQEEWYYGITDMVCRGTDNKGGVLIRFESKEAMPHGLLHTKQSMPQDSFAIM